MEGRRLSQRAGPGPQGTAGKGKVGHIICIEHLGGLLRSQRGLRPQPDRRLAHTRRRASMRHIFACLRQACAVRSFHTRLAPSEAHVKVLLPATQSGSKREAGACPVDPRYR